VEHALAGSRGVPRRHDVTCVGKHRSVEAVCIRDAESVNIVLDSGWHKARLQFGRIEKEFRQEETYGVLDTNSVCNGVGCTQEVA